ncbi:MAG TPA: ElyC/SanA/YdcF family protein [Candidatus Limnocylindrales bacterium]|nr:ElyC/SanA/YdcF family protein [Candidatus Limnocylindrales bacterium]
MRSFGRGLVAAVFTVAALVTGAGAWVRLAAAGHVFEAAAAPAAPVVIVFGAQLADGGQRPLAVLRNRLDTAAELFRAGLVSWLLVSGDGRGASGDEPAAMTRYLVAAGVAAEAIVADGSGLDSHATCRRARDVFGVRRALLVTQGFHLPRAVALCRAAGIDAEGVLAGCGDCDPARLVWNTGRDWLAAPKAAWDVLTDRVQAGARGRWIQRNCRWARVVWHRDRGPHPARAQPGHIGAAVSAAAHGRAGGRRAHAGGGHAGPGAQPAVFRFVGAAGRFPPR